MGRVAFVRLGREAVARGYPGELAHFPEALASFLADPQAVRRRRKLDPPVGAGIDLPLLTPYVLATVSYLLGLASQSIADQALGALGRATRERLRAVLERKRDADEPGTAATEAAQSEGVPVAAEPVAESGPIPIVLDQYQEREIYQLLVERCTAMGLDKRRAQYVAEAVIGALRLRAGETPN